VVLPWSMWPMVPTLTCGFVRSKTSLAIFFSAFRNSQPSRCWTGRG